MKNLKEIIATKDYENGCLLLEMNTHTNHFSVELLNGILHWLESVKVDKQIHSVILTGKGKIFSVGGDLKGMVVAMRGDQPEAYVMEIVPRINKVIHKIITHPLPIITVINGSAAGGGLSMALAGDHRIAKENIKLAFAFGTIGLTPDSGSSTLFPYRFGHSFALQNTLIGGVVTSEIAFEKGAIDIVSSDPLLEALKLAKKYKNVDRWTIENTKRLMNKPLVDMIVSQADDELNSIVTASKRDTTINKISDLFNKMNK